MFKRWEEKCKRLVNLKEGIIKFDKNLNRKTKWKKGSFQ